MYFHYSICESFFLFYFISFIWFALFRESKASFQKCVFDPSLQEQIRIEVMRNILIFKLDIPLSLIINPPPPISLTELKHAREEYTIATRITGMYFYVVCIFSRPSILYLYFCTYFRKIFSK